MDECHSRLETRCATVESWFCRASGENAVGPTNTGSDKMTPDSVKVGHVASLPAPLVRGAGVRYEC